MFKKLIFPCFAAVVLLTDCNAFSSKTVENATPSTRASMEQVAPETYARYMAEKPNSFLWMSTQGLDGQKVGALDEKVAQFDKLTKAAGKEIPAIPADAQLSAVEQLDKGPVKEATIFGGQRALKLTAYVPAAMAIGYLILIVCFALSGGYKAVEIGAHRDHPPTAKEAYEEGEEGPTSGQA